MILGLGRIVFGAFFVIAFSTIPHARDYGQYRDAQPEIRAWIENLTNNRGMPCCADADGIVPDAWERQKEHYRVHIYGAWHVVPDSAVVRGPNRLGHAIVWILPSADAFLIRCFLPGPEA